MVYNVNIETRAKQELQESASWYEQQSEGLGIRFIDSFIGIIDYLELHAESFPIIERGYRQAVMKSFPFIIVYKISENQINIVAVFHTGRNPKMKLQ